MHSLTGKQLAVLLNLEPEEAGLLQHLGLSQHAENGTVLYYYIRISTNNPRHILDKINMDNEYVARFTPEKLERVLRIS